jgi:hypothetical protein
MFDRMAVIGIVLVAGCDDYNDPVAPEGPEATVVTASGDITAKVDEFRNLLGASNGGTAGEQPAGRREISWDGAGANPFNNQNNFPADFFNTNVRSGAVFTTPGTGFRNDSLRFKEVNPTYETQFGFFSANRIFTAIGSNQLDVLFRVAGEPSPARVRAFGIVLSDVDQAGATTLQLFAADGASLGSFAAPVRTDAAGLSFIAVSFADPIIARARLTLGTGAIGANVNDVSSGGTVDLVVTDNFIYSEPRRIQ